MSIMYLVGFGAVGLFFIGIGLLDIIFPRMGWWWEEFKMRMRGIEAKPNKTYDMWHKISGIFSVILGTILIIAGIALFLAFNINI